MQFGIVFISELWVSVSGSVAGVLLFLTEFVLGIIFV
jgi:hypothetical protein